MSLRASIYYEDGWSRLWGWCGFGPSDQPVAATPVAKVAAKTQANTRAKATAKANAQARAEAPHVQWQKLLAKQGMQSDWVKLARCCEILNPKLSKNQARRNYLDRPNAWKLQGRKLRNPIDWEQRPGQRGGVPPIFVRKAKLKGVFLKYYVMK
jgi:hypothetical protein